MRFFILYISLSFLVHSCATSSEDSASSNLKKDISITKDKIQFYLSKNYEENRQFYLHKFVKGYYNTFDSLFEIGITKKDFDSIQKDLAIIISKNSFQLDSLFFERVSFDELEKNTDFALYKIYRNYLTLFASVHCNGNNIYAFKKLDGNSVILNNKNNYSTRDTIEMINFFQVADSNYINSNFIHKIIKEKDTIWVGGPKDICPYAKYDNYGNQTKIKLFNLKKGNYDVYIEMCYLDAYNIYHWIERKHQIKVN